MMNLFMNPMELSVNWHPTWVLFFEKEPFFRGNTKAPKDSIQVNWYHVLNSIGTLDENDIMLRFFQLQGVRKIKILRL